MSLSIKIRILALDYGRRRMGVAITDPLRITAQSLKPIHIKNQNEGVSAVMNLIEEYGKMEIVLGLPLDKNGHEGEMAKEVKDFGKKLNKAAGVEVNYFDERFTSVQAERTLIEMGVKTGHNKSRIDTMSAVFLLQTYLERKNI